MKMFNLMLKQQENGKTEAENNKKNIESFNGGDTHAKCIISYLLDVAQ